MGARRLPPAHGRVRGRRAETGGTGRASPGDRPGRGVHHRSQRDLGRRRGDRTRPGRAHRHRRGDPDAGRRHHRPVPGRADSLRAPGGRSHHPDQGPGRPGLRAAPVRPGPVEPGQGAARPVRARRRGHRGGLQRQDRRPGAERPGRRAGRGVFPARRGRLGRARRARRGRGVPGDARLRRPGRLPGRAGRRPAHRGVPPARPPLPAPRETRSITGRCGWPGARGGNWRRRGTARWISPA
jgi:hypothetical protein